VYYVENAQTVSARALGWRFALTKILRKTANPVAGISVPGDRW